nr:hypothetical protein [Dyadobacter sp. MSC1_007]
MIESHGIKPKDLVLAEALVNENSEHIVTKWQEFHGNS